MVNWVAVRAARLDFLNLNVDRNRYVSNSARSERCANCKIGDALHMRATHYAFVIRSNINKQLVQGNILLSQRSDEIAVLQPSYG